MRDPLLHKVAKGDDQAMDELLDRYGGLVYSLARRFCYETSEVDDAVQEVFVAIWQSAHRFDQAIGTEETFVSMLARRRLIDRRRRTIRRRAGQVDADVGVMDDGVRTRHAPPPGADPLTLESELIDKALALLDALKPDQQTCLRLSIARGLSHEEIARATGIPLGTVKTHVRRGLIALRDALNAPNQQTQRTQRSQPTQPSSAQPAATLRPIVSVKTSGSTP
ncbi:MAG: RNA polymerase sigma factor [Phycisphaerales bacterium]